jgi:hypothetical protein
VRRCDLSGPQGVMMVAAPEASILAPSALDKNRRFRTIP